MCGLCGVLGAEHHWTEGPVARGPVAAAPGARSRQQERLHRVRISNKVLAHYGLRLSDWQGASYVLRNRTGRQVIVPHLSALWPAAEALAGQPCDPLDPGLVEAMERAGR